MENQNNKGKFLRGGLAVAFGLIFSGCDNGEIGKMETERKRDYNIQLAADTIESEIRQITTYADFNGRSGLSYNSFAEIVGIPKYIKGHDQSSVWIEVTPEGESPNNLMKNTSQKGVYYDLGQSITNEGFVRIDVPYRFASTFLTDLSRYSDEKLGIKRVSLEELKNLPAGGY